MLLVSSRTMISPRIGSLPASLQHFLFPIVPCRSLHSSPSRSNSVLKDLLKEASNEQELRQAVEVIGEWFLKANSKVRWDKAPEFLDIIVDRAPSLNATTFALDVFTDLTTYHFPTIPPPRSQFRKLVQAVVHQPTVVPSSSSPSPSSSTFTPLTTSFTPLTPLTANPLLAPAVPRSHLNYLRHLYPRLFETDPYRNLLLLQGYASLPSSEGSSWKFFLESLTTKHQHTWTRIEHYSPLEENLSRSRQEEIAFRAARDGPNAAARAKEVAAGGGMEMLHFDRKEAQEMIRAVDSLRGVYVGRDSFLEAWEGGPDRVGGGLDFGRAGVRFHRDRIWELLQENLKNKSNGSASSSSSSSSSVARPLSPTVTRLKAMYPSQPLTPHLISTYLALPSQYHPSDPLILLCELHLRALLLPLVGRKEFDEALKRVEKVATVKGYDSWEARMRREGGVGWWTEEDKERMRACLGSPEVREWVRERRGWWDALDGVF
ncbi:hypothetical protein BDY24DRAFT_375216 [Mrakia frigida]|uniref:uncharacterized protein n=1 Tax=Mrakia frigida TaxID=29902 RepID=UPI003FCC12DD